ncbi:MAG: oxygen-independent coproporphyrinogen III oxidase [Pseudomonadota bacterium]
MTPDLIAKYSTPVPRYTSYPTAPNFSKGVNGDIFSYWLNKLPEMAALSLYTHVPFCHELCWYCGCNTKATRKYTPVGDYVTNVLREIEKVAGAVPNSALVHHLHWGGGSPNILSARDIYRLSNALRRGFSFSKAAEFAIEVDPRWHTPCQTLAFLSAGVTRVSVGVQDFDERVQAAINRKQSFEQTKSVIDGFRNGGVQSINIDLVYGLPNQTRATVKKTIEKVIELQPDRIALFGYAHLPQRLPQQRLIKTNELPNSVERFAQAKRLAYRLTEVGYVRVGLDHFARVDDPMVVDGARRNFQGYTNDAADALIGLGASAISQLPQGFAQNATAAADYARRIQDSGLATVRGHEMNMDDHMRAFVIEKLMCDLEFSSRSIVQRFGDAAIPLVQAAKNVMDSDVDGLVNPTLDGFKVTDKGRPFVRWLAAWFDAYLDHTPAQFSSGI